MLSKYIKKYNELPVTLKATFWFTICSFILKGLSFITTPIFAAILSTEEYGAMSIYYSYEQIFIIFATFELSYGAYQRGILKFKEDESLFTSSIIALGNLITIFNMFIFALFNDWITSFTNISITILTLMFIYFFVQPSYNAWLTKKRFTYEYKPAVIATILFTLITTTISLLAVYFVKQTAGVKIISMLVAEIFFCLPFYIRHINIGFMIKNVNKVIEYWKYALKFQTPLIFHSLSYLILGQSDRIMIGYMVNNTKAAIYSVAYNLATAIIIFQQSINQVFKPWRYQKMELKDYDSIRVNTTYITIFLAVLIGMFILIAPEIIQLLFNENYYEAIWTIVPVSIGVFFMFIYSIFSDIETYFHKTQYMAYASIACAIINICLNYFGIKVFGYLACAYATLITYIIFSVLHYLFMRKVLNETKINNSIYDIKSICFISILILLYGGIILMVYEKTILRYCLLIIIVMISILNRKKIISILNNIKNKS